MRMLISMILLAMLLASCEFAPQRPTAAQTPLPPTASFQPSPTPQSAGEQLEYGLMLRAIGEHAAAAEQFHDLIDRSPTDVRVPTAAFYLAESFVLRERWASAVAALEPIAAAEPPGAYGARARFLLARSYEQTGQDAQAEEMYQRYADLNTPIGAYAQFRRGDVLLRLGKPELAAVAYEQTATSSLVPGERALAYERAIAAQQAAQHPDEALRLYVALLDLAKEPSYRARILFDAATTAQALGDSLRRVAWLQEILEQSPAAPQAAAAADLLLADPYYTPDPALAALVFSNAERWVAARSQFDAAIAGSSGAIQLDLRRRRALTFREGDSPDYAAALTALDQILAEAQPTSDVASQARLDRIQTLGQRGDRAAAVAAYRAYAAEQPNDPRAPEALRRAALLLDGLDDPVAAADVRYDLARRYADTTQGRDAFFAAGLGLYQTGRIAEAAKAWEFQSNQSAGIIAAQGAYWAGRAKRESGDLAGGNILLKRAALLAPESYYAARTEDLLGITRQGKTPVTAIVQVQDWTALNDWVGQWAAPLVGGQSEQTMATLMQAQTGFLARAIALDEVGLAAEARAEWRAAWQSYLDDPRALALLARIAHEHGRADVALDSVDQLIDQIPASARTRMPVIIARLRLPTPYALSVLASAQEQQIDPLLLYALIRQESRFAPQIRSVAGAYGLAQVMPDTARGIAEHLRVAEFRDSDLARPALNIRFGAFYLGTQLRQLEDNVYAALAAYNGGPTNAIRWLQAPGTSDPDRFIEGIDYDETRAYVKIVYGNYAAYQRLYKQP